MDPSDTRALLSALRDLLSSAQHLVQHLLVLHGGSDALVTPPPRARLALPAAVASPRRDRPAAPRASAKRTRHR
jgi:hypothetical protein